MLLGATLSAGCATGVADSPNCVAGTTATTNDFGIDAVSGVVDLGGNTASGNGNPLQCRNVFCG